MAQSSKIIQNRILSYVAEMQGGYKIGKTDLAFSVARLYNNWVTDAIAHKYWCAIYDLVEEGELKNIDWETF